MSQFQQNNKNEIPDWPCKDCRFWQKFFDTFDYTYKEYCSHPCQFNPNFPDWRCTFGSEFKPKTTL